MRKTLTKKEEHTLQEYENAIMDGSFLRAICGNDHTEQQHVISDAETLNRIISPQEHKMCASRFESTSNCSDFLNDSVYYKLREIIMWKSDADNFEKRLFTVSFDEELVGHGFKCHQSKIKTYDTDTLSFVLQKDNDYNHFGLKLITAYPDLERGVTVTPTNRNLLPILQQTETYKNANTTKRAKLENMVINEKECWHQRLSDINEKNAHIEHSRTDNQLNFSD